MPLTEEEIRWLLNELRWVTVIKRTPDFNYRIQQERGGYQEGMAGQIQSKLSIELEMKTQ